MASTFLFNVEKIEEALQEFLQSFDAINSKLAIKRDPFTEDLLVNIIEAYRFLNGQLSEGIRLFSPAGLHAMLELNHIILCGTDSRIRLEYHRHVVETRNRYNAAIARLQKWVLRKHKMLKATELASEFYYRAISQPQLFIEGNHRTENIVVNYILASKGHAPFIITPDNAHDYLQISGMLKFTNSESMRHGLWKAPKWKKHFQKLLVREADKSFIMAESREQSGDLVDI